MEKLNVFVSSTCFDLSQVRIDLKEYIEGCGYNPILSEFKNFPVNPSKKTVTNCIDAVKNNADIFILIVGNRYGSQIESGHSITNIEYLTARDKGIPIYIFINKKVLNILPVWKRNTSGNFSDVVDTVKIFEFISEMREDSKLWTFEFDSAQDIILMLKTQMSYLFKDALRVSSKLTNEVEDVFKAELSNKALNLILEKREYFEMQFFFQTMIDELEKKEFLKNDYEYSIILTSKFAFYNNIELVSWVQERLEVLNNLIRSINNLIHNAFKYFYGEQGIPSDLKGLYYTSKTYARIYENMVQWTIETSSSCVNKECITLRDKLSQLSRKMLNQIWRFPFENLELINRELTNPLSEATSETVKLTLTIEIDEEAIDEYNLEFENFKQMLL